MITNEKLLELLLSTYLEMVRIKSKEPGECSHMLAYHTEFIKRQIMLVIKQNSKKVSWDD